MPQITYRVARPGWFNYEDWPGNFLLVPPGNDLAGVNEGTSDYIGVYTAIQPSHIAEPDGCVIEPTAGHWNTPRDVARYFRDDPLLRTTRPKPVSVGGLDGVVITSRIKPGVRLPQCTVDGFTFDLAGLFSGIPPSYLDHSLVRNGAMRLYLLAFNDHVLAIELDDIDEAPATMFQLDRAARNLRFNVGCG